MPKKHGGPKTDRGKAIVRYNAVKHGITSESPVIPVVENEDDWLALRDSIFQSIQPQGGLEEALAERVAVLLWRLMRIVRYERESVANAQARVGKDLALAAAYSREKLPSEPTPEIVQRIDRMLMDRLLPDDATLNKIMRYETRLHRHLLQTLHQLALIKGFRQSLPHNSKHGMANLDPPPLTRVPALPQGPSLSAGA